MCRVVIFLYACVYLVNTQNPKCLANFTYFPNTDKCYRAFGGRFDGVAPATFAIAREYCRQFNGGHLASIHSDEEITFLVDLARRAIVADDNFGAAMWIGLSYLGSYNWEWEDGTDFNYTKWYFWNAIMDDNHNQQNPNGILHVRRQFTGTMYSFSNSAVWPFVCQAPSINEG